jgi:hypothetical protein
MSYHYYQLGVAADEKWKPVHASKLDTIEGAMFSTVLSVDVPVPAEPKRNNLPNSSTRGHYTLIWMMLTLQALPLNMRGSL